MLRLHGARIAIASRKREGLLAAAAELAAEGIETHVDSCDVRDAAAVQRVVAGIVGRFGSLDIVVNNAAGDRPAPLTEISPKGFKAVVDIELLGTYNVSKAALDAWARRARRQDREHQRAVRTQGRGDAIARHGGQSRSRFVRPHQCRRVAPVRHPGERHLPAPIRGTEGVRRFAMSMPGAAARNPFGIIGHGADIAYQASTSVVTQPDFVVTQPGSCPAR